MVSNEPQQPVSAEQIEAIRVWLNGPMEHNFTDHNAAIRKCEKLLRAIDERDHRLIHITYYMNKMTDENCDLRSEVAGLAETMQTMQRELASREEIIEQRNGQLQSLREALRWCLDPFVEPPANMMEVLAEMTGEKG